MNINVRNVRVDAQFTHAMHDTIEAILTSGQKENVISLTSVFVFGKSCSRLVYTGFLLRKTQIDLSFA